MTLTRAPAHEVTTRRVNQTTPCVDQSQTYTSHPSHQVFLRKYAVDADFDAATRPPPATAARPAPGGGMATWADVKAQAATMLGIA